MYNHVKSEKIWTCLDSFDVYAVHIQTNKQTNRQTAKYFRCILGFKNASRPSSISTLNNGIFKISQKSKAFGYNLPWGHAMSHTKFRPDRFSRLDILLDTNVNNQIDRQARLNIFIHAYILPWSGFDTVDRKNPVLSTSNILKTK